LQSPKQHGTLRYRTETTFIIRTGVKRGPIAPQQLKELATQGKITPNTPLETDTGHKGLAGQIRGLFSAPPLNPSLATPPVNQAAPQCASAPATAGNKGLLLIAIGGGVLILLVGIAIGWTVMSGSSTPSGNQPEQAGNVQASPMNDVVNDGQPLPPELSPESEEHIVTEFRHTGSNVNSAAFSPDGTRIVTTNLDLTALVQVWDIRTGKVLQTLQGHASSVIIALFSPDGKKIVTASNDNTARIWDAESGRELHTLAGAFEPGNVRSAVFSPDGKKVFTGSVTPVRDAEGASGRIWDVESGRLLQTLEGRVNDGAVIAFSPDGKKVVAGVGQVAQIWDVESGTVLRTLEEHTTGRVISASFSPDGTKVVTAANFPLQDGHDARIWDVESGAMLRVLEGHTGGIWSALFSPDGTKVVTASFDQTARIWDTESGAVLRVLDEHTGNVRFASFSPDGTKVITAGFDHTARIWILAE